jgi:C1A family cysteine protease
VVIENENKFLFDPKQYPQGNAGVFFLEIDAPQKAPVIRTLTAVNDTLMINYPDFATETSDAATRYSLGYHDKTSANHDQLVVSFEPYFDQVNEMEAMVANTIRAYAAVTAKDAVRDSVYRNVYANSGKPNGLLFTELFDKYWANKGIMAVGGQPGGTGSVFDEQTFLNVPKLSASVGATRDELPANFSLRQYAPPIGNQGQYGSCVAWSTAYACRTIAFAVDHGYSINNHYELIKNDSFAPDFIYNNIRTSADCNSGTSLAAALTFMKNNGNLLKAGDFICGKNYTPADLNGATPYKIKDFLRVNDPGMAKADMIQKMKSMLVNKRALSFGMHTPPSFQHVAASGIWYPTDADRLSAARAKNFQEPYVGHAMCVVGYNDAINNGSFEVMNSWGTWNGNLGFYWINYDDFYRFTNEVYAIEDFPAENPPAPAPSPAPVLAPIFVNIPPVAKTNIPPAPAVIVAKPKLKGSMEFMQLKTNNSFETIPVTKKQIGTRGQVVEGDNTADGYANFVLTKPMHSGDRYKIKFNVGSPAYVYVIGMDKESNYTLFPQKSKNESALINIKNTNLFLPNDSAHYTLDNVTGKEKMCILVSKSPISVDELNKAYASADHNLYQAVRNSLNKRLVEMKAVDYVASGSIGFDTVVNDNNVLAFFIEIEHL